MPNERKTSLGSFVNDRRRMSILLLCILVSSISWLLISLQRTYTTTLIVPIQYINLPEEKTLVNDVPNQLAVQVAGSGFDLISYDRSGLKDTFLVNIGNLTLNKYGAFERGFLNQAELSKDIQRRLNGSVSIQRIISDSLVFLFDLQVTRTLPVKPRTNLSFEKGFVQNGDITVQPAEIQVRGALSILDTMTAIYTETINLDRLDANEEVEALISVDNIGAEGFVSERKVKVSVPVDQLTEKSFMVEPALLNVPEGFELRTFPKSVEVTVTLPLSSYDDFTPDDVLLSVDYEDLEQGYLVLPVKQEEWPLFADRIRVKPDKVEIVLTKLQ